MVHETDREALCEAMGEQDMVPEAMALTSDAHLLNLARLAAWILGAVIIGPAGVGKTTFLELLKAELRQNSDRPIITMALTHRAARIAGGVTIAIPTHIRSLGRRR